MTCGSSRSREDPALLSFRLEGHLLYPVSRSLRRIGRGLWFRAEGDDLCQHRPSCRREQRAGQRDDKRSERPH